MSADGKPIRQLVVLSDLHCGSTVALMPPDFKTIEGQVLAQNALQRWLWDSWQRAQEYIALMTGGDPFALVLNGDLIEGIHHGTKQVISPDATDHSNAAIAVLEPLARLAAKTFVVAGTECHVNNHEVSIARALGAETNPESGFKAFNRLTVDVCGVRCVFRHHIPATTRRNLRGSQLSLTLAEEQIEATCNSEPIPRVVVCSHRHQFDHYTNGQGLIIVTPPWQALTRHGHKIVTASRTKPGVVILDWRFRKDGELPDIHAKTYDTPAPTAIKL